MRGKSLSGDLIEHLEAGNRLSKPELCPPDMFNVMERCWRETPEERPTFQELLTLFTVLLERATEGYGYLSLLKTTNEHYEKLNRLALTKSFCQDASTLQSIRDDPKSAKRHSQVEEVIRAVTKKYRK